MFQLKNPNVKQQIYFVIQFIPDNTFLTQDFLSACLNLVKITISLKLKTH